MSASASAAGYPRERGAATDDTARSDRIFGLIQERGAFAVLAALVLICSVAFDGFLTGENLKNILLHNSFLGLLVVGQTFVIISGGIDLSVGSLVALGGVLAAQASGRGVVVALLFPIAVCGAVGLLNGVLVAKGRLAPFIVTLASLLGVRGWALLKSGAVTLPVPGSPALESLGRGEVLGIPAPVWIMLAAFAVGGLVLNRTRYGEALFAVGGGDAAARLAGVDVDRVKIVAYVISGALAGLSGALLAGFLNAGQPLVGAQFELYAIAAVVVGGTLLTGGAGSMAGSLAGLLLFGVLQNMINLVGTLTSYVQQMVSGLFLIVVVLIQTYLARKRAG
jgi:ribose/xylose/arabinose/galactoside ABC-type transport system permease subunit